MQLIIAISHAVPLMIDLAIGSIVVDRVGLCDCEVVKPSSGVDRLDVDGDAGEGDVEGALEMDQY